MRVNAGIALSRVYRESGDLGRAIDTGERILADLAESGLDSCDEAVQLTVTLAAAYFERGDSGHAVRICRAAIAKAEALGSPRARASAYWNASAMQARRGDILNAAPLAERALALLGEGQDTRNLARLRTELGRLQLALDPPDVEQARQNLEKAADELDWSSAAPVDKAWTQLGLARARFLAGDLAGSRELTSEVHEISEGHAPLAEAEARALEGQTYAAEGDMDDGCPDLPGGRPPAVGHRRRPRCGAALVRSGRPARRGRAGRSRPRRVQAGGRVDRTAHEHEQPHAHAGLVDSATGRRSSRRRRSRCRSAAPDGLGLHLGGAHRGSRAQEGEVATATATTSFLAMVFMGSPGYSQQMSSG